MTRMEKWDATATLIERIHTRLEALESRLTDLEKDLNDLADRVTENGG